MKNIKYSIIIPTQNRSTVLEQCLYNISKLYKTKYDFEVLVIDNASTDNTKDIVNQYKSKIKNLKYFYDENPGLHVGRHMGAQNANGDILCFLDDDSFVDKNWLFAIEETFQNEKIHIATGKVSPKFEVKPPAWFKYLWETTYYGRVLYKYSLLELNNRFMRIPPDFVFGCNFIIRKKTFFDCGGVNPDGMPYKYLIYRGDGESKLVFTAASKGLDIVYNPKILIGHYITKNRITKNYLKTRAQRSAFSHAYKDIREEYGIYCYPKYLIETESRNIIKKTGINTRAKKEAELINKEFFQDMKKYYYWYKTEFKKNKILQKWVLKENYIENGIIPNQFNFNLNFINVYSGEPVESWILGKFAKNLKEEYLKYGIKASLTSTEKRKDADFNHYIIYCHCDVETANEKDIIMITHIDKFKKIELLEKLMNKVRLGICMSKDQMDKLINYGFDKNKLCYINPPHDNVIHAKKIVIGIASRVYTDGRKKEWYLNNLADVIDPRYFKFKIMGANWEPQVEYMRQKDFEVEYYDNFNYEIYTQKFFADMDYYLYMGTDEGQMGFVDAQSAGVKTIVTAQGFHLDSDCPITHPFMTYEELEKIFLNLQQEKMNIVDAMHDWTWKNYALKHLQIMEYLKTGKIIENDFKDGLNSLLTNINSKPLFDKKAKEDYIEYLNIPTVNRKIDYDYSQNCKYKDKKQINILQKIFSVRNETNNTIKRKLITIFGIKIAIKVKKGVE